MRKLYLDNAASTPIEPKVKEEMVRATEVYGNPSSFNDAGRLARAELEKARLKVARFLGAKQEEIIFTGSGSEANNQAIFSVANFSGKKSRSEFIVSPIEHPSVLEPIRFLERAGIIKVKFLKVDEFGFVDLIDLKSKLTKNTALVSVMYANNEIGTIEPIVKISKIINEFRRKNPKTNLLFHVDACQAVGYLDVDPNHLGADLLVFNGAKIYGPKGIGVLYANRKIKLKPIIWGGDQEKGLRAGTENLPAIAGLAKATELIDKKDGRRLAELRDYFFKKIAETDEDLKINGPLDTLRLPNNINISVPDMDSEDLLLELDKYGIYAGSGSACTSHSVESSHVLSAIGTRKRYQNGALRFSMGRWTTKGDIDYLLVALSKTLKTLKKRDQS